MYTNKSYKSCAINILTCSNQAGDDILKTIIEMEKRGIKRENLALADIEKVVSNSAFNNKGRTKYLFNLMTFYFIVFTVRVSLFIISRWVQQKCCDR